MKHEKKIIIILLVFWMLTKPFTYLRFTNLTITIVIILEMVHYIFKLLYDRYNHSINKVMRKIMSAVLIVSSIIFLVTQLFIYIVPYKDSLGLEERKLDYVIVLGAGLRGDKLSHALQNRLDRLLQLDLSHNAIIVLSGGQGPDELITEASAMAKYLIENDVDESIIVLEEKSTSTFENFKFSLEVLDEEGLSLNDKSNIAIVSNDFHIFRSKFLLKRLGYDSVGVAAKTPGTVKVDYFFREFFAVIHSFIFDR